MRKSVKTYIHEKGNLLMLCGIFLLMCLLKFVIILQVVGPKVFYDELLYKEMAKALSNGVLYQHTQYPMGYPLVLSIAFLWKDNFYMAMKIINILITSGMVFIVWKLARLFLDEKKSLICVIISSLLPFHYIYIKYILSENLYYPIFFLTIYYMVKSSISNRNRDCFLFGALLGMMMLTRYVSVVLVPVFILFWFIDIYYDETGFKIKFNKNLLKKALIVIGSLIIIYSPWILRAIIYNISTKSMLGLDISDGTAGENIGDYATIWSFFKWCFLFLFYLILMVAPFVDVLLRTPEVILKKELNRLEQKYILSSIMITGGLCAAAVRHSWMAAYNYPEPTYILGRYIVYVSILWIITYFILEKKVDKYNNTSKIYTYMVGITLIIISLSVIIGGKLINISANFISEFNAPDAYIFKLPIVICGLGGMLVLSFLYLINNKYKWIKYAGIISFYALSTLSLMLPSNVRVLNQRAEHAKNILKALEEYDIDKNEIIIDTTGIPDLEASLKFWEKDFIGDVIWETNDKGKVIREKSKFNIITSDTMDECVLNANEKGLLVSTTYLKDTPVYSYKVQNYPSYIYAYKLPLEIKDMKIRDIHIQDDTEKVSAWFEVENIIPNSKLYINGQENEYTLNKEQNIATAYIPESYMQGQLLEVKFRYEVNEKVFIDSNTTYASSNSDIKYAAIIHEKCKELGLLDGGNIVDTIGIKNLDKNLKYIEKDSKYRVITQSNSVDIENISSGVLISNILLDIQEEVHEIHLDELTMYIYKLPLSFNQMIINEAHITPQDDQGNINMWIKGENILKGSKLYINGQEQEFVLNLEEDLVTTTIPKEFLVKNSIEVKFIYYIEGDYSIRSNEVIVELS